jgi:hypothetical protein
MITLKSKKFPGNFKEDGFWAGLYAARSGKVYIGLCSEGGVAAHFYIYDPLSDIYFSTGNMGAGPHNVDPRSWQGGRWCMYNPVTDMLEDLGPVLPRAGIYGLVYEPVKNRLYGVATNGHFVMFDIDKRETFDLGRINQEAKSAARTLVIDDEGNVFGTYVPGRIFKYDTKREKLYDLSVQIPADDDIFPKTISIFKRVMRAGVWDSFGKKMYGIEGATSGLFEYDPFWGNEGRIKVIADLRPENTVGIFKKSHYASLCFAMGSDSTFYYLPIAPFESGEENDGIEFDDWAGEAHLVTYNLDQDIKQDHGRVFTEDGSRVIDWVNRAPSGGGTVGADNTIYFCDFVEERDSEEIAHNVSNIPLRLRLLILQPELIKS